MKNTRTVTIAKKALSALIFSSSIALCAPLSVFAESNSAAEDIEAIAMDTLQREGHSLEAQMNDVRAQKVNINLASFEQLVSLPGIGKVKASAILRYRKEVGMFKSLQDLQNIKGIGEKLYTRLQSKITI